MGILDDAIREHLELKRQRGADESELKQLEDEAFGPPTRPGEADFPETGESPEQSGNGVAAETAVAEAPGAPEAPVTPLPDEPDTSAEPEPDTGAEPAIEEEEAHDEGGEPQEAGEPRFAESSEEIAEPSEEPTTLYDRGAEEELEFGDVDLTLDEGHEGTPAERPLEEAEQASQEPHGEADAPIETLETVEHPFPEELVKPTPPDEEIPPSEPLPEREEPLPAPEEEQAAEEEHPAEEQPAEEEEHPAEEGEEGEDVLADTPEFLKDAPEDDELWFEQREPKDFDF